jgi:hypothetical protein
MATTIRREGDVVSSACFNRKLGDGERASYLRQGGGILSLAALLAAGQISDNKGGAPW